MNIRLAAAVILALLGAAGVASADPPAEPPRSREELAALGNYLEKAYAGREAPESVRMLIAISRGELDGEHGWFGPAQTRYTWEWLAGLHGRGAADGVTKEQFRGPEKWFARLDRNKDGRITPDDLDWSDRNPYVQQAAMVTRLFRRMDRKPDGRLTQEELLEFFKAASQGKDYLTPDDLRDALLSGVGGSFAPGDAPTPEVLVRSLFQGELGSLNEGPRVGERAPDFSLKTHDGKQTIRLSDHRGKPVVLVFGNFTCGPFRAMYPAVDEIAQRYRDDATFLGVYVREAHPTDGWHMAANDRVGVKVAQPKTYDERVTVAQQCQAMLKYSMPLLVDEINDPVGNAYSGMPSRLYVIDADGRVVYKNGRGPFGFKPGEMEQALVMALLERHAAAKDAPPAKDR